jgi:transketolase
MVHRAKSGHVGTSFSMVDILAVLYYGVLRIDPANPGLPGRDRFILSKGHGCAALYAVLAECGFFPLSWLDTYYLDGSHLAGHVTHHGIPGVEVSTGSLGHGLSIGCGMAVAAKYDNLQYRVFVVLGDGECDEGAIWEASLFASHHRLDNLVAIVDYNKIQSLGRVKDILNLEPFLDKWLAFGWAVKEIDGHNYWQIEDTLKNVPFEPGKPSCIIAHTVKGKGVSFMENSVMWHYSHPDDKQLAQALNELEF